MNTVFATVLQDAFKLAAKMLGSSSDAQDVIQDAAAVAISHKNAPDFTSEEFTSWFFKVVRNKAIDKLRVSKRERTKYEKNEDVFSQLPDTKTANPEQTMSAQQQQSNIAQALQNISLAHREIILLKDYHEFSYADIASILDIAKGSVMSRLHRARHELKIELLTLINEGN